MKDINVNEKSSCTIRGRLRIALLNGKRITPLTGVYDFGSMDIRKRLSELRREGMDITDEWEQDAMSGKHYKVHYMTKEAIENYKQNH